MDVLKGEEAKRVASGWRGTFITGLGAVLYRRFEKSRFYRLKVRIANPQISRAEAALNVPVTDRRVARPSSDGPEQFGSSTQAHTANENLSRPRGVGPK